MPTVPSNRFTQLTLQPQTYPERVLHRTPRFAAGLKLLAGTLVAIITAANANEVQTLTPGGTVSGGTATLIVSGAQVTINASDTAATVKSKIEAALTATYGLPAGTIGVTGGPLTSGALTITFQGACGNQPQPLIQVASALTGSSPTLTAARTTSGVSNGAAVAYNGTLVTAPTTAPTVAGNGSGSAFAAGSVAVQYTWANTNGETTPSPAAFVTLTAGQNVRVSALTAPSGATKANYYVNGVFVASTNVSGGSAAQTDLSGSAIAVGGGVPVVNSAYVATDGSQLPAGWTVRDIATDPGGNITLGILPGGGEKGATFGVEAVAFSGGVWNTSELTGLDANAVSKLGKLISGSVSNGLLHLY